MIERQAHSEVQKIVDASLSLIQSKEEEMGRERRKEMEILQENTV
jgi:hypothetical protein